MEYKVIVGWDSKNQRFFIVESDVEGLWLEKPSFDELVEAIRDVAPDLIAHNHEASNQAILRIFREVETPLAMSI